MHSTPTIPASNAETALIRPSGLVIQWHLSDRCNLRCQHCYQSDFRDGDDHLESWLSRLEQFRTLFQRRAPDTTARLTLTGGEPFALKDFPKLLEKVAGYRHEFSFAILTNGTLIDSRIAEQLRRHQPAYVQISIDGGEATHDAIRGKGNHASAVNGIRALVAAGIPTIVAFTAQRHNYQEFPEVARLAAELGVTRVWSDRVIPEGQSCQSAVLTPQETRAYTELMAQARTQQQKHPTTEVALKRALQFLPGSDPAYYCKAATSLIAVMPNGDVYPCRRLPIAAGNLNQHSLTEIYDSPAMAGLRTALQTPPECADCLYASLCRGGLRCLAYAANGHLQQRDPGCWLTPD